MIGRSGEFELLTLQLLLPLSCDFSHIGIVLDAMCLSAVDSVFFSYISSDLM